MTRKPCSKPTPARMPYFVMLSGMDLILTLAILEHPSQRGRELNPLAAHAFREWGWWAMALWKLASVSLVLFLCRRIARSHVRRASQVLSAGCWILGLLLIYSSLVYFSAAKEQSREDGMRQATNLEAQRYVEELAAHQARLDEWLKRLSQRQCKLADAVDELMLSSFVENVRWKRRLAHRYDGPTEQSRLALHLIHGMAFAAINGDSLAHEVLAELMLEYEETHGIPVCWLAQWYTQEADRSQSQSRTDS